MFLSFVLLAVTSLSLDEAAAEQSEETATFAGGCFWCMEFPFDRVDGVLNTTVGYTGGKKDKPSYKEVSAGGTGHTEAIQVKFDPKKVGFDYLLKVFWQNIDPLDAAGQFCDKGSQYRSGIFYHDEAQKKLAEESKKFLEASKKLSRPVVTEITQASKFFPAEGYHQNYYKKNPIRYKLYRGGCGRDRRLKQLNIESLYR